METRETPAPHPTRRRHGRYNLRASKAAILRAMEAASRPRPPYDGPTKACDACGFVLPAFLSVCPACHESCYVPPAPKTCRRCGASEVAEACRSCKGQSKGHADCCPACNNDGETMECSARCELGGEDGFDEDGAVELAVQNGGPLPARRAA